MTILHPAEPEDIPEEDLEAASFYDDLRSGEYFKQTFRIEPEYETEDEELKWLQEL